MTDREKFILARWAYGMGTPIISDAEYTILLNKLTAEDSNWEYVTRSWSSDPCPTDLLRSNNMEHLIAPIILAEKTESIPSLNSWFEVQQMYANTDFGYSTTISYKHDGWNVQANYYNGKLIDVRSRGRAADALDVSVLSAIVPGIIPEMGSVRVVGECTCSKELFKTMAIVFGNANERSAVRTAIAHPEYTDKLSFHAFDINGIQIDSAKIFPKLRSWGFTVPSYATVTSYDSLKSLIEAMSKDSPVYPSPTDGLVVRNGNVRNAIRVGAWEEPIYQSYITDYEQSYGAHIISMNVLIKPVHTNKGMQYRLSVTNCKRIVENNLRKGYPVAFKITSSAYADFDEESTRLLQAQWAGKEDSYREMVDQKEAAYVMLANPG